MAHRHGQDTYGRVAIIDGMDSGMSGPKATMAVPHVQEQSGFRATTTTGTAVIAIMPATGVKFVEGVSRDGHESL